MNLKIFLCIFLWCSLSFSSQVSQASSDISLSIPATGVFRDLASDMSLHVQATLVSISSDTIIYSPQNPNRADLPSQIYMCPGELRLDLADSSVWATSDTFANTSYSSQNPNFCPNVLRPAGHSCFGLACNVVCPWDSSSSQIAIQWGADDLLSAMSSPLTTFINKYSPYYEQILTSGNKINADYYHTLGNPDPYPNQQSEAALVCKGYSITTLNANQHSSQRLIGVSPSLSSSNYDLSTPGVYQLGAYIDSQSCIGSVHILPDNGDNTRDRKYSHYLDPDATTTFSSTPAVFTVHVVDPQTCSDFSSSISPSQITNLIAGADYPLKITVVNNNEFFSMTAKNVRVVDANSNGWSVRPATAPNGFSPDAILPSSNGELKIVATAPNPLIQSQQVCFDVDFESTMPKCNGQNCTTTIRECIDIDPSFTCNVSIAPFSPSSDLSLSLGEDLILQTTCFLDSNPVPCPTLTWTATGFDGGSTTQNISFVSILDTDGTAPDSFSPYDELPPSTGYSKPAPYVPSNSGDKIVITTNSPTTSNPIAKTALFTYNSFPSITPPTTAGNVIVTGTDAQGNDFECSVQGSSPNQEFIEVPDVVFPDYVPILSKILISGQPSIGNEVYQITWGTKNIGAGVGSKYSHSTFNGTSNSYVDISRVDPPFGPNQQKTTMYNFACPHPGAFRFTVNVDSQNKVLEQPPDGENNNLASMVIYCSTVLACPDYI